MKTWLKATVVAAVLAAAFLAISAFAQEQEGDDEGIPAYSVARLRVFSGTAWVRTSDSGEWEEFSTNSPIPERARVSIPDGSEAELQFHGGQGVLLTAGSEIDIRQLGDERSAFRLRSGEIRFDLPESDFAPVRVLIPGGGNVAFPVPGRYWVTARDDGQTQFVVRRGQGTVSNDRGEFTVTAGQEAMIGADVRIGPFAGGTDTYEEAPPLSDAERGAGVPPYAADELRDYGEWVESPDYGYVWRPRVAVGWSPYFYGQWDWVSPFGWTWVSFEPWGWWPYHYGYWCSDPLFGWVWSPYRSFVSVGFTFGSFRTHHFLSRCDFSPATVRFVRDGRNVRWVPLRPGERGGRIAFTRSDTRLAGWERPLSRGTVFVRQGGQGSRMWRDYNTARGERRPIVRESVGRSAPGSAPGVRRGQETRPGSAERLRGGEGRPGFESPRGRGGVTEPRGREIAPRPERMDRQGPSPQRGRDSRIERRYDGGVRAGAPTGGARRQELQARQYTPRTPGRQAERIRQFGPNPAPTRREAPRAVGLERRAAPAAPRIDRGGAVRPGGRPSFQTPSGGSGGGWDRGGGRDTTSFGSRGGGDGRGSRDSAGSGSRGGGRDVSGFGSRGGGDWRGGRGGR